MGIFRRGPKGPEIRVKTYKSARSLETATKAYVKDRAKMERDGWSVTSENRERSWAFSTFVVTYQRDR